MGTLRNVSFAGGIVSPSIEARPELIKNATGLRQCRNWFVQRHGALANRPGTKFVAESHTSAQKNRLIPFVFNDANSFVLAFNALRMRVLKNGAQISDASVGITAITQANPGAVTTAAPHNRATGDEVAFSGIDGMTPLNGRNFKIVVTGASAFEIQDMDGVNFDTSGLPAYVGPSGTAAFIFEVPSPYTEAQLPNVRFTQSADVMTLAHPAHPVQEVRRVSDTVWTLELMEFKLSIPRPTNIAETGSVGGALNISYIVTAIDGAGQESGAGRSGVVTATAISQASPALVSAAGHAVVDGEEVIIEGSSGMPEVRNRTFDVITPIVPGTSFTIVEDTTTYLDLVFTLTVGVRGLNLVGVAAPAAIVLTWDNIPTAVAYRIYRRDVVTGVYGFIGESVGPTFEDTGITPDLAFLPPVERVPFFKAGLFPAAVAYYQQRLCFGGSDDFPENITCSVIGQFPNFYTYIPGSDSDAVIFALIGEKVSRVKHLLDVRSLVVFSSSIEWAVLGSASGALTPTSINALAQSYNGSGERRPIVIGGNAVFLQARGAIVRDLSFDFDVQGYRGNELTIFANQLFDNFTILDWDFQQIQNSIMWAVRSDGKLLALTYVREHQIFAWTLHDWQGGTVESVATIAEGLEDILYVTVKRTINGRTARYIEQMKTRLVDATKIEDSVFVDSALSFDGRNVGATTMEISGGPPWGTFDPPLTLTASTNEFSAASVGNEVVVRSTTIVDGVPVVDEVRFMIEGFTSPTVVTGSPNKDVPVSLQGVAVTDWDLAVDELTGLFHLEGEQVSVFADGFVIANPNNSQYAILTVVNGQITLPDPRAVIHVGRPFTSDIETLDIDTLNSETLIDKKMLISRLTFFFEETRGIFAGEALPPTDLVQPVSAGGTLHELKIRESELLSEPVALKTGPADIEIKGRWKQGGRVVIRQTDPLPAKIASVAVAGLIPLRR